jgi:methionyl-tRNA formyltransferase
MKVLFIGKEGDALSDAAALHVSKLFKNATVVKGTRNKELPQEVVNWNGDYIFSYLSPWIIPSSVLDNAIVGGINWHPGSPDYPGIGCTNFAIYDGAKRFGMTCHWMNPKVDTGKIIETSYFPVTREDSVYSITQKCYTDILKSFYSITEKIAAKEPLPESDETWRRIPYKRKELNALSRLTPDMSSEEMERRIKATKYINHWAYIEVNGRKFYAKD